MNNALFILLPYPVLITTVLGVCCAERKPCESTNAAADGYSYVGSSECLIRIGYFIDPVG